MLITIARFAYVVPIMGLMFMLLYILGGEDIIFFRRKKCVYMSNLVYSVSHYLIC